MILYVVAIGVALGPSQHVPHLQSAYIRNDQPFLQAEECKFRAVDTRPIIPRMTARLFGVLRYALRGVDLDLSLLEDETLVIVLGAGPGYVIEEIKRR